MPTFDGMSGGFKFSDEFPRQLDPFESQLFFPTISLMRKLWAYRKSIVSAAPRDDLAEWWDATKSAAPNWPGFLPERRSAVMLPMAEECETASIRLCEGLDEFDRQWNAQAQFVEKLRLQLESDILDYGRILRIADDCQVASDLLPVTITKAVYHAVAKLLEEGAAEIGDAEDIDGSVTVRPWPESFDERKSRLEDVIDHLGTAPEPGKGFWLVQALDKKGTKENANDVDSFFAKCGRWLRGGLSDR